MPPVRVSDVNVLGKLVSGVYKPSQCFVDGDSAVDARGLTSPHGVQERDRVSITASDSTGSLKENATTRANGRGGLKPRNRALARTISLKGVRLQPTIVFDTFWRFAAERKAIDARRRSGMAQPWTDDPILQKYPFCNTFRVLDRVCQYIIQDVIEKGSQDPTELVFRIALFNMFTKIETWELLVEQLGPLTWERYSRQHYQRVLSQAKREGMTLYTGAFQKPAPHFGFADAYMNHLVLLEMFMENDLARRLQNAKYLAEVYEYLISFPGMGEFSTYQLILNLSYSRVLNFSNMDFVVPGPGASSGLSKMFGSSMKAAKGAVPSIEVDVIHWLAKHQDQHFERLGLEFSGLGPDHLPMDLADIEHLLCEVDKYSRIAHPKIEGKRTEIRRTFTPSPGDYPAEPTLPEAWSHPARKIVRIRPGGLPRIEKRYTVHHIGAHRNEAKGVEYRVYWEGYADSEATWEPEENLKDDAPLAVEEYWRAKKGT